MVRLATLDDHDALVEGNCAMALETEDLQLDPEIVRKGVRAVLEGKQAGAYYVIEGDGGVVAQLMITFEWSDWRNGVWWWIQSVYVLPGERRHGVYRTLYARARKLAAAAGDVRGFRLYVERDNQAAQAVYRALGMNESGYRMYEVEC